MNNPMDQAPSVGRIVHYTSYGTPNGEYVSEPRAAIITAVHGDDDFKHIKIVSLCVLNPTGMFFNTGVPYSPEPKPGYWSWPKRED